ncbi:hypothetical protein MHYP_G00242460 [Metynnis hypsauchen]
MKKEYKEREKLKTSNKKRSDKKQEVKPERNGVEESTLLDLTRSRLYDVVVVDRQEDRQKNGACAGREASEVMDRALARQWDSQTP